MAYYRVRDFIQSEKQRQRREKHDAELKREVKRMALTFATYGHRPLQREILAHGVKIGREKVRRILAELGLSPKPVKSPRRATLEVTAAVNYPPGRRLQIDATQVKLETGKTWLYLVEDVPSRALLAIRAVHRLAKESAREVLAEAVGVLRKLAIAEPLVIQSDGGSDFTSQLFQDYCRKVGCWIRSKVNQKGGMGILERLNRSLKYEWLFRHEYCTLFELQALAEGFKAWYNHERRHSSLAYQTPWRHLTKNNEAGLEHDSQAICPLASVSSGAHGSLPNDTSLRATLAGPFFAQIEASKPLVRIANAQDDENHNLPVAVQSPVPSRIAPSPSG